jgi:hypothetical protein
MAAMSEVTRILSEIEQGDPAAAEQLLPLVYQELRKLAAAKLAQEKPSPSLLLIEARGYGEVIIDYETGWIEP